MEKGHRHELIDNFSKYRIGLDDMFAFKCRGCGNCCKNREDIMLTSRDLNNIAAVLRMAHNEVIEKYCEVYIGQDSRIPIVRLMPKGVNKACPLLVNDRCLVHSHKPAVCALFPLGRVVASEEAPEEMGLGKPGEIEYVLTHAPCGAHRTKQKVRTWLEKANLPVRDEFFINWNKTLFALMTTMQKYEKDDAVTDIAIEMLRSGIFIALYTDYDIQREFYPQFEDNADKILNILATLEQHRGGDNY